MEYELDPECHPSPCKGLALPASWSVRDQAHLWHPFTQAQTAPPALPIVRGKGALLYSETGQAYVDGISSWWVNLHGHAHPYIAEKIATQALELEHVLFAGYTHPQAILLAERLLALLPSSYSRLFYSDNGSTAVEVALKMALQMAGNGKTLLSFKGAYHGDTFGAMSAAGPSYYNRPFWPYLFHVHSISLPSPGNEDLSWREFEAALDREEIAAFIFEPLIQGAGGMRLYSREVLERMLCACQERKILTIADEVLTGFGRTGPLFISSELQSTPDLLCLSKGITGGFLPLGATIVKESLFESFLSPDPSRAFLHGHSYTANPLACAAANASLDLLLDSRCTEARARIERAHLRFQGKWQGHEQLSRLDVLGTILALEYKQERLKKDELIAFFQDRGIILRPLGQVLYILPPYCISEGELEQIYQSIEITLTDGTL